MKIYSPTFDELAEFTDANSFGRTSCNVSDGKATITRVLYFRADFQFETAADILALEVYPSVGSAHPKYSQYKYTGNASIEPFSETSLLWQASLEYATTYTKVSSSSSPGSTDDQDNKTDSEPWKLAPESVRVSFPEMMVTRERAINPETPTTADVPIVNSAGDIIPIEHPKRNTRIEFTFNVKTWDIETAHWLAHTTNNSALNICGLSVVEKSCILEKYDGTFHTVYEDNSTEVKWKYWSVDVSILVAFDLVTVEKLDIGNRAHFDPLLYSDALLTDVFLPDSKGPICKIRKAKKMGEKNYLPLGDLFFCSWEQYIILRQAYIAVSKKMNLDPLYDLQCEQMSDMPLLRSGNLDLGAIDGTEPYRTLFFQMYPAADWGALELPSKGVVQKWT